MPPELTKQGDLNMKKIYDTPLAKLLTLSFCDVITSSGNSTGGSSGGSSSGGNSGGSSGGDWVIDGGAL